MPLFTVDDARKMVETANARLGHVEKHFVKCIKAEGGANAIRKWGHQLAALQTIREHCGQLTDIIGDPYLVMMWFGTFQAYIAKLRSQYGEAFVQQITGPLEKYAPMDITTPAVPTDVTSSNPVVSDTAVS